MRPPDNLSPQTAAFNVAIVQNKPQKGRYAHNLQTAAAAFAQLSEAEHPPDLVVLPEAALTGYFLEGAVYDLALPAARFAADLAGAWTQAAGSRDVDLTCGFYENDEGTYYNSSVYLEIRGGEHRIAHVHRKMFLPTYGVFDEERFLSRGRRLRTFPTRFGRAALLICEDVWHAIMPTLAALSGARLLIVPSAAPGRGVEGAEELESIGHWQNLLRAAAAEHGVFVLYAGLTGFEGGKGMTGSSSVVSPRGNVVVSAPAIGECIVRATLDAREIDLARANLPLLGDLQAVFPDLLADARAALEEQS